MSRLAVKVAEALGIGALGAVGDQLTRYIAEGTIEGVGRVRSLGGVNRRDAEGVGAGVGTGIGSIFRAFFGMPPAGSAAPPPAAMAYPAAPNPTTPAGALTLQCKLGGVCDDSCACHASDAPEALGASGLMFGADVSDRRREREAEERRAREAARQAERDRVRAGEISAAIQGERLRDTEADLAALQAQLAQEQARTAEAIASAKKAGRRPHVNIVRRNDLAKASEKALTSDDLRAILAELRATPAAPAPAAPAAPAFPYPYGAPMMPYPFGPPMPYGASYGAPMMPGFPYAPDAPAPEVPEAPAEYDLSAFSLMGVADPGFDYPADEPAAPSACASGGCHRG